MSLDFSKQHAHRNQPNSHDRLWIRRRCLFVAVVALLMASLFLNTLLLSMLFHNQQKMSTITRDVTNKCNFLNAKSPCKASKSVDNAKHAVWPISADRPNCTATTVSSDIFVPIFVLTRDRVTDLQQTLESYRRTLSSRYEVIILDHNSTYPPMLEYLQILRRRSNLTVHTLSEPVWDDALAHADRLIQDYLRQRPDVQYYVLTDPDIALLRTQPDILIFFAGILTACPDVRVIGPHLQISDIPARFQGKYQGHSAYEWESQFWKDTVPYMAEFRGVGYHFAEQLIDTTFAMRRRTQRFARITCPCVRTYAPYAAVHLDWYLDSQHPPVDKQYYLRHSFGGVNNW